MHLRLRLTLTVILLVVVLSAWVRFFAFPAIEAKLTGPSEDRTTNIPALLRGASGALARSRPASRAARIEAAVWFAGQERLRQALKGAGIVADKRVATYGVIEGLMEEAEEKGLIKPARVVVVGADGLEVASTPSPPRAGQRDWREVQGIKTLLAAKSLGRPGEFLGESADTFGVGGPVIFVSAPIVGDDGAFGGAVGLVFKPDHEMVNAERKLTVMDVGFFSKAGLVTSTLDNLVNEEISKGLRENFAAYEKQIAESPDGVYVTRLDVRGRPFLLALSYEAFAAKQTTLGTALIVNLERETYYLGDLSGQLAALTAGLLLVGIALVLAFAARAYRAVDFVVEGAQNIIMGARDFEFTSNDKYLNEIGGTLNLMNATLTGKVVADDEDLASLRGASKAARDAALAKIKAKQQAKRAAGPRPGEDPESDAAEAERIADEYADSGSDTPAAVLPSSPATPATPATPAADDGEGEAAYFDRLYNEYADAKRALGQEVNTTREKLEQTLRRNEESLKEKHNCRAVKFEVVVSGDRVTFKPIPVRD